MRRASSRSQAVHELIAARRASRIQQLASICCQGMATYSTWRSRAPSAGSRLIPADWGRRGGGGNRAFAGIPKPTGERAPRRGRWFGDRHGSPLNGFQLAAWKRCQVVRLSQRRDRGDMMSESVTRGDKCELLAGRPPLRPASGSGYNGRVVGPRRRNRKGSR